MRVKKPPAKTQDKISSFGSSTVVHAKGGRVAYLVMMLFMVSFFHGPTSTSVEMNG